MAKNIAAENALREIVIQRMRAHPKNELKVIGNTDPPSGKKKGGDLVAEVPMIQLIGFALHKLYLNWKSEGVEVPNFHCKSYKRVNSFKSTHKYTIIFNFFFFYFRKNKHLK